jgi:hypothetical protein
VRLSLFPGGSVGGLRFPFRKTRARAEPPGVPFSPELAEAIDTATVSVRSADDDGPRVMFISDRLGGAWIYSEDEANRRIRARFPELSDEGVTRGIRHLESRAAKATMPTPKEQRRNSWVWGWAE